MSFFQRRLEAFPRLADYRLAKAAGYWPYYKTVESASRPRFIIEGNEYINFGSNNYLSLSYHPEVIEAAQRATSKYGTGVTGSRLLNGTLDLHRELEHELADVLRPGGGARLLHRLRRERQHDQRPPPPPRLRRSSTRTRTTRSSPARSSRAPR